MAWSIHPGNAILTTHRDVWQQVNRDYNQSHPLLDIKFVAPLFANFGSERVYLAVNTEGTRATGVALLESRGRGMWQLFLPSQAPVGPAIFAGPPQAPVDGRCLDALMHALPGYGWLIGLLKQDPAYGGVVCDRDAAAGCSESLSDVHTVNIQVDGSFKEYWDARSKNLSNKMRRLLRKLEESGTSPRLVEHRRVDEMADAVARHGELECAGWKAGAGTAVHRDNVQGRFYTAMLEQFAAADGASVFQLYFDELLVASQLTVMQNGMMVLLKTAHDESAAALSPGRMLDYLMLERVFGERRVRLIEFYTNASQEDLRWSTGGRELYHVNYFRSGLWKGLIGGLRGLRRAGMRLRHRTAVPAITFLSAVIPFTVLSSEIL